jgi:hypothetical protein
MKSSNAIAKKNAQIKQSQGKSERCFVLHPGITPDKINGEITQKNAKIKQNTAKSERGFRPSPHNTRIRKRTIKTTIRKKQKKISGRQAITTIRQDTIVKTRIRNTIDNDNDTAPHDNNARMKQSQAKSERGFVLATPIATDI